MSERNEDQEECCLQHDIAATLADDRTQDVTLQSSDGQQIYANRYVLASRSPVFRNMFYGHFQESSVAVTAGSSLRPSPAITVNYGAAVVQHLVHYCYTDKLINEDQKEEQVPSPAPKRARKTCSLKGSSYHGVNSEQDNNSPNERDENFSGLLDAANFYIMRGLARVAMREIVKQMGNDPTVACAVLCQFAHHAENDAFLKEIG
jgi:hypothetical protein